MCSVSYVRYRILYMSSLYAPEDSVLGQSNTPQLRIDSMREFD